MVMKIEVWSDIACPFCYIGKRNLETALQQFDHADTVQVEWRSFQLDPGLPKNRVFSSTYQYLAERKGLSVDRAKAMTRSVAETGARAGVILDFDRTIIANTWDGHRLIHLAQSSGNGTAVKEALFRAHFTDGQDISDHRTLIAVATSCGLDEEAVASMLKDDGFGREVERDIREAQDIGIRGVPFFVFNRQYAVSGAQPPEVFLQTLQKASTEGNVTDGPTCDTAGNCD